MFRLHAGGRASRSPTTRPASTSRCARDGLQADAAGGGAGRQGALPARPRRGGPAAPRHRHPLLLDLLGALGDAGARAGSSSTWCWRSASSSTRAGSRSRSSASSPAGDDQVGYVNRIAGDFTLDKRAAGRAQRGDGGHRHRPGAVRGHAEAARPRGARGAHATACATRSSTPTARPRSWRTTASCCEIEDAARLDFVLRGVGEPARAGRPGDPRVGQRAAPTTSCGTCWACPRARKRS